MKSYVFLFALMMGCGGSSTFELKITADIDNSVSDADLAKIKSFTISVTGDELFSQSVTLTSTATRENHLIFVPDSAARTVEVTVLALDASGNASGDGIAEGMSSQIELTPNKTNTTVIELSAIALDLDLAMPDLVDTTSADL